MNIYAAIEGAIGIVNPYVGATLLASTGYTMALDRSQVPTYAAPVPVTVQKQALSAKELAQVDGLNIQGEMTAFYARIPMRGVVRAESKGGDIIQLDAVYGVSPVERWLVVQILEEWPDYCKVAACRQL